jgi:ribosome maturation factor RimP
LEWGSGWPPLFFTPVFGVRGPSRGGRNRTERTVAKPIPEIDAELEARVEDLGMEVVEIEWAGSDRRPILRLRVDFPGSQPGDGVTVEDCVRVSRAIEPWLDEHPHLPEKYTVEVSSPGVERPLHRKRDFRRFEGDLVALKGRQPLGGTKSKRLEGELAGIREGSDEEQYSVLIRRKGGEVLAVPRNDIEKAHLVFRWKDDH